jgi:hypothetical protein
MFLRKVRESGQGGLSNSSFRGIITPKGRRRIYPSSDSFLVQCHMKRWAVSPASGFFGASSITFVVLLGIDIVDE